MPLRGQLVTDFRRHAGLNHNVAAAFRANGETRILKSGLDVHAIVDEIRNKLSVSEWLVCSAHDAETNVLVSLFHERRNDCVEGALARGEHVGGGRIEREKRAAILQDKPHAADGDAGSELLVIALNEGNNVASTIHHAEVGGFACRRLAEISGAVGFVGINKL